MLFSPGETPKSDILVAFQRLTCRIFTYSLVCFNHLPERFPFQPPFSVFRLQIVSQAVARATFIHEIPGFPSVRSLDLFTPHFTKTVYPGHFSPSLQWMLSPGHCRLYTCCNHKDHPALIPGLSFTTCSPWQHTSYCLSLCFRVWFLLLVVSGTGFPLKDAACSWI